MRSSSTSTLRFSRSSWMRCRSSGQTSARCWSRSNASSNGPVPIGEAPSRSRPPSTRPAGWSCRASSPRRASSRAARRCAHPTRRSRSSTSGRSPASRRAGRRAETAPRACADRSASRGARRGRGATRRTPLRAPRRSLGSPVREDPDCSRRRPRSPSVRNARAAVSVTTTSLWIARIPSERRSHNTSPRRPYRCAT